MSAFNYSVPPVESIVGSIHKDVTRYIDGVCAELDISVSDLVSPCRKRHLSDLRQLLMFILRDEFEMTFEEIGRLFHRDHTTAVHGCKKMMLYIETKQINLFHGTYLRAAETVYQSQWGRNLKIFQNGI
jgi:chromosomal replication initiation ATPase DnaA